MLLSCDRGLGLGADSCQPQGVGPAAASAARRSRMSTTVTSRSSSSLRPVERHHPLQRRHRPASGSCTTWSRSSTMSQRRSPIRTRPRTRGAIGAAAAKQRQRLGTWRAWRRPRRSAAGRAGRAGCRSAGHHPVRVDQPQPVRVAPDRHRHALDRRDLQRRRRPAPAPAAARTAVSASRARRSASRSRSKDRRPAGRRRPRRGSARRGRGLASGTAISRDHELRPVRTIVLAHALDARPPPAPRTSYSAISVQAASSARPASGTAEVRPARRNRGRQPSAGSAVAQPRRRRVAAAGGRCASAGARGILHQPAAQLRERDAATRRLLGRERGRRHAGLGVGLQQDQAREPARLVPAEVGPRRPRQPSAAVRAQRDSRGRPRRSPPAPRPGPRGATRPARTWRRSRTSRR